MGWGCCKCWQLTMRERGSGNYKIGKCDMYGRTTAHLTLHNDEGMKLEHPSSKMQNFCTTRSPTWQTWGQPNLALVVLPNPPSPAVPLLPSPHLLQKFQLSAKSLHPSPQLWFWWMQHLLFFCFFCTCQLVLFCSLPAWPVITLVSFSLVTTFLSCHRVHFTLYYAAHQSGPLAQLWQVPNAFTSHKASSKACRLFFPLGSGVVLMRTNCPCCLSEQH